MVLESGAKLEGIFEIDNKINHFADIFGTEADNYWKQQQKD